ncbi:hypothetical protein [Spirosoma arboris]|nr:hypothetical protein [Spirosoma arboris]
MHPIATYEALPYKRTLFGAIGSDGAIYACEYTHLSKQTKKFQVGKAIVDDHCAPAFYAASGRRSVIAWANHNKDHLIHYRVGELSGDITAWETETIIDLGNVASYAQIHRLNAESDTTQDTFIVFNRLNNHQWTAMTFSVNQATGAFTVTRPPRIILSGNNKQTYITTADAFNATGNQVIRIAMGFNPEATSHSVYYLELDAVTGALTSPVTSTLSANIYTQTSTPVSDNSLSALIPDNSGDAESRRLYYVRSGPAEPAIAYLDYSKSTPMKGTYKTISKASATFKALAIGTPKGGAVAAYKRAMNMSDFEVRTKCSFSVTPTTSTTLASRVVGGEGWWFELLANRTVKFTCRTGSSTMKTVTTKAAIPGSFSAMIGYGFKYRDDVAGLARAYFQYCLDGTNWIDLGNGSGSSMGSTGTIIPITSDAPFVVLGGVESTTAIIQTAQLLDFNQVVVTSVDFTTLASGLTRFTTPSGDSWTVTSGASITTASGNSWLINTFGIAGQGFSSGLPSYIGGMNFPTPCYDDIVYLTRRNSTNTNSTLERYTRPDINSTYTQSILIPTSALYLARPYSPIGANVIPVLYVELTSYGPSYTTYSGAIGAYTEP